VTQQSFVQFLEPYIDEVANFALYSHYQYFDVDRLLFERFKPLVSAVVELKTEEAKESFVGVYNNLIAPSMASDGAAPLVALSLSWVVMHDDEQYVYCSIVLSSSALVCDVSVFLSRFITACLHSLT
jgi:hypothetical protein